MTVEILTGFVRNHLQLHHIFLWWRGTEPKIWNPGRYRKSSGRSIFGFKLDFFYLSSLCKHWTLKLSYRGIRAKTTRNLLIKSNAYFFLQCIILDDLKNLLSENKSLENKMIKHSYLYLICPLHKLRWQLSQCIYESLGSSACVFSNLPNL